MITLYQSQSCFPSLHPATCRSPLTGTPGEPAPLRHATTTGCRSPGVREPNSPCPHDVGRPHSCSLDVLMSAAKLPYAQRLRIGPSTRIFLVKGMNPRRDTGNILSAVFDLKSREYWQRNGYRLFIAIHLLVAALAVKIVPCLV
jgi:hypothetical protein